MGLHFIKSHCVGHAEPTAAKYKECCFNPGWTHSEEKNVFINITATRLDSLCLNTQTTTAEVSCCLQLIAPVLTKLQPNIMLIYYKQL